MLDEIKFLVVIHGKHIPNVNKWSRRHPKNVKIFKSEDEWKKLYHLIDFGVEQDTKMKIITFDWSLITVGYTKRIMGITNEGPHDVLNIITNYLYPGKTPYVLFRCGSYGKTIYSGHKHHPYQTHTPVTSDEEDNNNAEDSNANDNQERKITFCV